VGVRLGLVVEKSRTNTRLETGYIVPSEMI
jgi:hypothetical protein